MFKKGDKVQLVTAFEPYLSYGLRAGVTYTVSHVNGSYLFLEGFSAALFPSAFKPVRTYTEAECKEKYAGILAHNADQAAEIGQLRREVENLQTTTEMDERTIRVITKDMEERVTQAAHRAEVSALKAALHIVANANARGGK